MTDVQSSESVLPVQTITEDEEALYDRQIRLWGVQGQVRLQAARALLIGVSAIGVEVAKNLILAGIGSLMLVDDASLEPRDLNVNFLARATELGFNKAEATARRAGALNPHVAVTADKRPAAELEDSFLAGFDVVVVARASPEQLQRIGRVVHEARHSFYATSCYGWGGFIFADAGAVHEYTLEQESSRDVSVSAAGAEVLASEPIPDTTKVRIRARIVCSSFADVVDRNAAPALISSMSVRERRRVSPYLAAVLASWTSAALTAADILAKAKALGLELDEQFATDFVRQSSTELKPVASILGGFLAQEVLNCLTQQQQPMNNTLIYDALSESARVYSL